MKNIQKKVGVLPDGLFGPKTARAIMKFYGLNVFEASHLLGQCAHESGGFKSFEENLNYSASQLIKVFGRYFPTVEIAKKYEYKPQAIANRAYANRMGNGDEASGDGWKRRGVGCIHLTGTNNQKRFSIWIKDPEAFCTPEIIKEKYAMETGIFFFEENNLFRLCKDVTDTTTMKISKGVNLGDVNSKYTPNHFNERNIWTKRIYTYLTK